MRKVEELVLLGTVTKIIFLPVPPGQTLPSMLCLLLPNNLITHSGFPVSLVIIVNAYLRHFLKADTGINYIIVSSVVQIWLQSGMEKSKNFIKS